MASLGICEQATYFRMCSFWEGQGRTAGLNVPSRWHSAGPRFYGSSCDFRSTVGAYELPKFWSFPKMAILSYTSNLPQNDMGVSKIRKDTQEMDRRNSPT